MRECFHLPVGFYGIGPFWPEIPPKTSIKASRLGVIGSDALNGEFTVYAKSK